MVNLTKTKAGVEHIPHIIELAKEIWLPAFSPYFSEKELNSLFQGMYNSEKIIKDIQNPLYEFYIVENSQRLCVGYFATFNYPNFLKLDKIYVAEKFKGQGIGKWMYNEILQQARLQHFHKIRLNVNRRNNPAIDFYKNLGFTILREENILGPNGFVYDDYVMGVDI